MVLTLSDCSISPSSSRLRLTSLWNYSLRTAAPLTTITSTCWRRNKFQKTLPTDSDPLYSYTGENVNGDGLWRPYLKLVFIMVDLGLTLEELKTQCHDWLMSISLNTSVTDMNLIVFLGNKTDLERPGNREVVEEFAKKVQALYFPVCASTGQGVEEALAESTKECHNKRSRNTLVKWDEFMGVEAAPSPQRMARRSSLTINFAMQE